MKWWFRDGLGDFNAYNGKDIDEANVELTDTSLKLHVAQDAKGVWKGAAVVYELQPFTYGTFAVRCRLPKGAFKGLAFLIWPDAGWPPEIDFYEIGSGWPERDRCPHTLHYDLNNLMVHGMLSGDFSVWQNIFCIWQPGRLDFQLRRGGQIVQQHTMYEHVPSTPLKLHLKSNPGSGPVYDEGYFEVEWVRFVGDEVTRT